MNKLKGRKTVFEQLSCFSWFRFIRWLLDGSNPSKMRLVTMVGGKKKAYHAAVKIIHVPWGPFAEITNLAEVLNLLRYLEPYGDSP